MLTSKSQKKTSRRQITKEDVKRHQLSWRQKGDALVESWNRTPVGAKLDRLYTRDADRARRVAFSLRNEHAHLKHLKEEGNQIKSIFSTRPENVLRMIRIGVGQSNRPNIGHEWQLTTPDDAYYFVDTITGSTLRDGVAGQSPYENMYEDYGTEYDKTTIQTANGSQTTFVFSFPVTPVIPLSVILIAGGKRIAVDNENGGWSGAALSGGSIDYQAGTATATFSTAPANGSEVYVEYNFDSENPNNYDQWGDIELRLRRDRFDARPHPLTYRYSKMFELVLNTTGVGDSEEMLIKRVGDTHAMRRDTKFFTRLRRQGASNPITIFDASFTNAGADNLYNHAQTLLQTIEKVNGNLYDDIKRGELNKFVMGTQAVAFAKMHKLWENDSSQKRVGGSYLAGRLDGKEVYVAPNAERGIRSNEIVGTYRNPDEDGDVNIAIGVMTELFAALDYPEMYRKGTLATVEDMRDISPRFTRIIQLENL
jgi:hypothetical protein